MKEFLGVMEKCFRLYHCGGYMGMFICQNTEMYS